MYCIVFVIRNCKVNVLYWKILSKKVFMYLNVYNIFISKLFMNYTFNYKEIRFTSHFCEKFKIFPQTPLFFFFLSDLRLHYNERNTNKVRFRVYIPLVSLASPRHGVKGLTYRTLLPSTERSDNTQFSSLPTQYKDPLI